MYFVGVIVGVSMGVGKVLDYCASEVYVNKLHTLAYSKDRPFVSYKKVKRLYLDDIKFSVDVFGTSVFLTEKSGSYVPTAGKNQHITILVNTGDKGGIGLYVKHIQCVLVVLGKFGSAHYGSSYICWILHNNIS